MKWADHIPSVEGVRTALRKNVPFKMPKKKMAKASASKGYWKAASKRAASAKRRKALASFVKSTQKAPVP